MPMTLSEKVRRIREKLGLNRKELAEKAGLHPSHISLIEKGGRTEVRPDTLDKLATALGVEKIYFLTDDPLQYIRVWVSSLSPEEQRRYLKMTQKAREDLIQAEIEDKWPEEELVEFYLEQSAHRAPDLTALTNPGLYRQLQEEDWEDYYRDNWVEILQESAERNDIPAPWVLCPEDYEQAMVLAVKHQISGRDLYKAVEYLVGIKANTQEPTVAADRPRNRTEATIHKIWTDIYSLDQLGIWDDLSLLDNERIPDALQAAKAVGLDISLADFMAHATVGSLAGLIEKRAVKDK